MNELQTPTAVESTASDAVVHRESLASFVEFAADVLEVQHTVADGVATLEFEHREHPAWPRPYQTRVAVASEKIDPLPRKVTSPIDGGHWLWNLAALERGALVARPASQPESVHEFSSRLFDAYQVDGGQMHLAGCRLIDVPFLRVTTLASDDASMVEHRYFDHTMKPVSESQLEQLGLVEVSPLASDTSPYSRPQVESLAEPCDTAAERFMALTVIVAKRAEGALQFDIGEQCARVRFGDWTRTIAAPPFRCAASGRDSYHLAAIDDGRIVAAEAIATCEESGASVLECERVKCGVTGKQVDPRLASKCPVSGEHVLKDEMATCHACQQSVSRLAVSGGVCKACRELPAAKPTDTWVAGLTEQFPTLKQYRKFRAGKLGELVRVMAIGWWRRLLVITAGEGGPVVEVARREGLAGRWEQVPHTEWSQVLGASQEQS
ncbi:hypothetical protein [Aeoliella sp.]|uniref:hypothetical protein n=1 Tax=Aeoliella sp. TaxID=2795800 RepID=UPI003CCBA26F